MDLAATIDELRESACEALEGISSEAKLEEWRVRYLGRRGELADLIGSVRTVEGPARKAAGQAANRAKTELQAAYEVSVQRFRAAARGAGGAVDVTLPGIPPTVGGLHLTRQTMYDFIRIFATMGFSVFETREVETDEYNFQLLNIPPDHPARDMHDTIYISDNLVLRTHTSPGQIRVMRELCPQPIRVILPGRCHRYEALDASHESMFYQIEGLAVGPGITLASLKGLFQAFASQMLGGEREVRFRGHYFPFTEPSVEIDITCNCFGRGCNLCKGTGWLEVSGGGMVHPVVLENGGYNPDEVSGFAFGMGIERPAILKHEIDDIRRFYSNDLRFLEQFT